MKTRKQKGGIFGSDSSSNTLSETVSLIVSHNTRIQCLLDGLTQNKDTKKIRFMNCCILKLEITPVKVTLSMVHEGELANSELGKISADKPYYVKEYVTRPPTPKYNPDDIQSSIINKEFPNFVKYPTTEYKLSDVQHLFKLPNITKKFTFYIARHGQAAHNLETNLGIFKMSSTAGMALDTSITDSAKFQANRAGIQLVKYIQANNLQMPTHFFVSDLVRTHQTLFAICESTKDWPNGLKIINKPIVLPCASELAMKGILGNCDEATSKSNLYKKIARENYPSCKTNINGTLGSSCNNQVDWQKIYLPFYGNKIRSEEKSITGSVFNRIRPREEQLHCRDTNMIAMAIYYLDNKTQPMTEYISQIKQYSLEPTESQLVLEPSDEIDPDIQDDYQIEPGKNVKAVKPQETYSLAWGGKQSRRKRKHRRTRKN